MSSTNSVHMLDLIQIHLIDLIKPLTPLSFDIFNFDYFLEAPRTFQTKWQKVSNKNVAIIPKLAELHDECREKIMKRLGCMHNTTQTRLIHMPSSQPLPQAFLPANVKFQSLWWSIIHATRVEDERKPSSLSLEPTQPSWTPSSTLWHTSKTL